MLLELEARKNIDRLLAQAGWHVCGVDQANIYAARGLCLIKHDAKANGAIREVNETLILPTLKRFIAKAA